jgi:hypothetical protein
MLVVRTAESSASSKEEQEEDDAPVHQFRRSTIVQRALVIDDASGTSRDFRRFGA